ncbi:hypothetical protein LamDB_37150 [Bacillus anthracis]|uniref:Uncharacterized protein n=1 Tax=Bacillus anthracis TaxID=1392 RepID=A0A640M8S6_BACAN|nr:small, acid-soluble spore protein [Bacillus anthracis str. UR-1]GAO60164.1 small acid-soluble spore protein [Bacillus anthracis]GAO65930.1 small acid-soluble spore protein [Bacillus anthracis]GEU01303.1 hypothetical protein DB1_33080 [Bacillus anthracis]GEU07351.1 hypothetical protein HG1_28360 [Bacillus anthracis]
MMANNNSGSRNELLVRGAESAINQMKYEKSHKSLVYNLVQTQQFVQTDLLVVKSQNV